MKNRRGFLLAEETLKIIIALICIGILVYLLSSLYFENKDEKDLELASASLLHLFEEMKKGNSEVEIYNPKGWNIWSWHESTGIPNSCSNFDWETCICICKNSWLGNDLENCDDKGTCLNNDEGFIIEPYINIEKPPVVLIIDKDNKRIELNEK